MSNEDNFSDDMFDYIQTEPVARLVKENFHAWHLPRKQYVRIRQWIDVINRNKRNIISEKKIKYLSLPGDDLLDLRVMHDEFCLKNDIEMQFLGFNKYPNSDSSRTEEINLSLVEVKELKHISPSSEIINNDIRCIGQKGAFANIKANQAGPFDIINLDFCDSIFYESPSSDGNNHYDLLQEIIYLQSTRRTPWLLYLTTRVGAEHISGETLSAFIDCFKQNIDNANFCQASSEHLEISNKSMVDDALLCPEAFSNITIISLCKWLLAHSLELKPGFSIEIKSAIEYKVNSNSTCADMISLALMFSPLDNRSNDKYNLSSMHTKSDSAFDEPLIAKGFVESIVKKTDCDERMQADRNVFSEMREQTKTLLSNARYNIEKYDDWLNTHFSCVR
jgi:hypothetical protein